MRRVVHSHGCLLVVVLVVHDFSVAVFQPEGDAPVGAYFHAVMTAQVAGKGVQPPAGKVHIVRGFGAVQADENGRDFCRVCRLDAGCVAAAVVAFEAFMAEADYHGCIGMVYGAIVAPGVTEGNQGCGRYYLPHVVNVSPPSGEIYIAQTRNLLVTLVTGVYLFVFIFKI